ncbi:hypothetical protein SAMN03159496_05886 [Rhizobium sp. NFR07]|nr:hypothetical protein SAMN03159496_05886 [Rhizobium sp. NFR07]
MDFLRSEFAFKSAALAIERGLSARSSSLAVDPEDLAEILLPLTSSADGERLLHGCRELAEMLSQSNSTPLKTARIQQKLARAFAGRTYQSLQQSFDFPTEFREIFPGAALPYGYLEAGQTQARPYPRELLAFPELSQWRTSWERSAVSTRERPFFPPMLPASYFQRYEPHYERRRDWRAAPINSSPHARPRSENGQSCVLVRHKGRHLIGAARWKWWGDSGYISGVGFSLYLLTRTGWLKTFFDIRPYYAEPTCGPFMYRDGRGEDRDHIQAGLEELSRLAVHVQIPRQSAP